jgi:hypothetical protein
MEGVRAPSITGHYRAVALELIIEPVFDNKAWKTSRLADNPEVHYELLPPD